MRQRELRIELQRAAAGGDWLAAPLARIIPAHEDGNKYSGGATYRADGSVESQADETHHERAAGMEGPKYYYLVFAQAPDNAARWRLVVRADANLAEWKSVENLAREFAE